MKQQSILKDFIVTILTLGLYNIYVQVRQIFDYNDLQKKTMSPSTVFLLSVLTFGGYFVYHEYRLTIDLQAQLLGEHRKLLSLWVIPATMIGVWPVVDSYQQMLINSAIKGEQNLSQNDKIQLAIIGVLYLSLVGFFWGASIFLG